MGDFWNTSKEEGGGRGLSGEPTKRLEGGNFQSHPPDLRRPRGAAG